MPADSMSMIIMMVVMIGVFYFFLIRPENKKKKAMNEMRNSLKVGDNITTIGGVVGDVGRGQGKGSRDSGPQAGEAEEGKEGKIIFLRAARRKRPAVRRCGKSFTPYKNTGCVPWNAPSFFDRSQQPGIG